MSKIIIIVAPSGAGKTTLIKSLFQNPRLSLMFSVSATNRLPREGEIDGKSYYFLSTDEFKARIERDEFVEWEEIYANQYYGTLKSEVNRIWELKSNIIFDIDVKGGLNIKKQYAENALSIFIKPPSLSELERRLVARGTETEESLKKRLRRAEWEISCADQFDRVVVNDVLEDAERELNREVERFLL